jgi:hypothetical protein
MNRCYDDGENEIDIEVEDPSVIGVIALLQSMERNRQALEDNEATLRYWLRIFPEFAKTWRKFTAAGGGSAQDFHQFARGKIRACPIRNKQHPRLVASSKPLPHRKLHGSEGAAKALHHPPGRPRPPRAASTRALTRN